MSAYGPSVAGALQSLQAISQAGIWIDPVNRERAAYLSGRIDVDEFERRVGGLLGLAPVLK